MGTWTADGLLSGYSSSYNAYPYKFAANGLVDLNARTRLQYVNPATEAQYINRLRATGGYNFSQAEANANAGRVLGIVMHVVPASSLPANPTIQQVIFASGKRTYRSAGFVASAGSLPFPQPAQNLVGPAANELEPNSKYWVVLIAASWARNSRVGTELATENNDFARARGNSFWTNRTPLAPVITTPSNKVLIASGTDFTLAWTPNDPDKGSDGNVWEVEDTAGAQVQFSPKPTIDNPNPEWRNLDYFTSTGARVDAWHIRNSTANGGSDGPTSLANSLNLAIRAGGTSQPSKGYLPSGDWRVRVRTLDFGHPFPRALNPIMHTGSMDISQYPAANVSPWSDPIIVTITAQVPVPLASRPVRDTAVPLGSPVSLLWAYRNTHLPPLPQKTRTVRIRRLDTADPWTTLVDNDPYGAPQLDLGPAGRPTLAGYVLVSGNRYEWQVKVTDSENISSDWSASATFIVVSEPNSGESTLEPIQTVEGALLGQGNNRAFIYRRGGKRLVGELKGKVSIEWNRTRDDISVAVVKVRGWDEPTAKMLATLQPWAYELVIFRENGFEVDRVWEGPISLPTFEWDQVTIQAKDVVNYAYRRILRQELNDALNGDSVIVRAVKVLQNAFAPDDPNVLAYLTPFYRDDDGNQYRNTPAYSRYAFEELDDMASNSGLDYTAVGRAILVWGTRNRIGTLPEFRDEHFGSPPVVSVYGMSFANRYAISDGQGLWGAADRLNAEGMDPDFGLVEMLSSNVSEDANDDSGTYTEEGRAKVEKAFAEHAESSIGSRNPPPVVVRVPDGTSLSPESPVSINQLVPGVAIPLRSTATLRKVFGTQKLDSIKVVQDDKGEVITVTMSSFTKSDDETSEAGEDEGDIA